MYSLTSFEKGVLFGLVVILALAITVSPSPLRLRQDGRPGDSRQANEDEVENRIRRGLTLTKERSLTGLLVLDKPHRPVEHLERLPQSPVIHKSQPKISKPLDRPSTLALKQELLTANGERSLSTEISNSTNLFDERTLKHSKRASLPGACAKRSRTRVLSLPNCANLTVDVGGCSGSCFNKQIPDTVAVLKDGVYIFQMNDRCRCCSVRRYENRRIPLVCVDEGTNIVYSKTVQVAIVKKCQCRTCMSANGSRI